MTRKDYIIIADIAANTLSLVPKDIQGLALDNICYELSAKNANFDPSKFQTYIKKKAPHLNL